MDQFFVNADAATLSPIGLFLQADWVVKFVMLGLLLASVWTWAIIVGFGVRMRRTVAASENFEREFWKAQDIDRFVQRHGEDDVPVARVLDAGIKEWRRSTNAKKVDAEGVRSRLATLMASASAGEIDALSGRLNVLATIGAVAPFVGLFGTVWGIMRSFTSIAAEQNSSLAVVAPGIAEALFATAIGLVAAIPAVMAFNYFMRRIKVLRSEMETFSQDYLNIIKRHFLR